MRVKARELKSVRGAGHCYHWDQNAGFCHGRHFGIQYVFFSLFDETLITRPACVQASPLLCQRSWVRGVRKGRKEKLLKRYCENNIHRRDAWLWPCQVNNTSPLLLSWGDCLWDCLVQQRASSRMASSSDSACGGRTGAKGYLICHRHDICRCDISLERYSLTLSYCGPAPDARVTKNFCVTFCERNILNSISTGFNLRLASARRNSKPVEIVEIYSDLRNRSFQHLSFRLFGKWSIFFRKPSPTHRFLNIPQGIPSLI